MAAREAAAARVEFCGLGYKAVGIESSKSSSESNSRPEAVRGVASGPLSQRPLGRGGLGHDPTTPGGLEGAVAAGDARFFTLESISNASVIALNISSSGSPSAS
eukprot:3863855-Prymnesium_polylepis.1